MGKYKAVRFDEVRFAENSYVSCMQDICNAMLYRYFFFFFIFSQIFLFVMRRASTAVFTVVSFATVLTVFCISFAVYSTFDLHRAFHFGSIARKVPEAGTWKFAVSKNLFNLMGCLVCFVLNLGFYVAILYYDWIYDSLDGLGKEGGVLDAVNLYRSVLPVAYLVTSAVLLIVGFLIIGPVYSVHDCFFYVTLNGGHGVVPNTIKADGISIELRDSTVIPLNMKKDEIHFLGNVVMVFTNDFESLSVYYQETFKAVKIVGNGVDKTIVYDSNLRKWIVR